MAGRVQILSRLPGRAPAAGLLLAVLVWTGCGEAPGARAPRAERGVLDLRQWDFQAKGPVRLDGQWEFQWKRLMRKADFARKTGEAPIYMPVPSNWNDHRIKGKKLPGLGFATYRLKILPPPGRRAMALKIFRMYSAYRVYADGRDIADNGIVARNAKESKPEYRTVLAVFETRGEPLELIVHISNFAHRKGGIFPHITMGDEEFMRADRDLRLIMETFMIGGLVVLGIYMLGLYFLRQLDSAPVWLGLFCLLLALRNSLENEKLFMFIAPDIPWEILMKMVYITFYAGIPVFIAYAQSLLRREFARPALIAIYGMGILSCLMVLALPTRVHSQLVFVLQAWAVLVGVYALFVVMRAAFRRRESSYLFLASILIMFLATLIRIMFDRGWVPVVDITRVAFLAFVFIQAILVSGRFSRSFLMTRQISRELEKRVDRRTAELRKSRDELARAKSRAEESNRAKSEFLAVMSHEIRTPLNAVIGTAEILSETARDEEQRKFTRVLNRAGKNLLNLINQVLDLSRADENRLVLRKRDFMIRDVVAGVCEIMRVKADEKNLSLSSWVDVQVPEMVNGDPDRLEQILINLLGNAVKFTDEGEVSLRVIRKSSGEYEFSVRDTGRGIPPELTETIFDRFTQLDSSSTRRHGGTGLGLAISRKLVELMHGEIRVENRAATDGAPGGSTFHFTARFQEAKTNSLNGGRERAGSRSTPRGPLRVLLVEDNEDNVMLITAFLKKSGVTLETAVNGLEGVSRAAGEKFDLILMDVQMPVMDGYTATRRIREAEMKNGKTPVPIIALTANAAAEDAQRSFAAGCEAHLTKPVTKQVLLEAIHTHARPDEDELS